MSRKQWEVREELKLECARYYVKNKSTIRDTAEVFGLSKTTVHKMLIEVMEGKCFFGDDINLNHHVRRLIEENKLERAIRGGKSTKRKYSKKK